MTTAKPPFTPHPTRAASMTSPRRARRNPEPQPLTVRTGLQLAWSGAVIFFAGWLIVTGLRLIFA